MTLLSKILATYPEVDAAAGEALDQVADAAQTLGRKGTVTLKFVAEKQGARVLVDVGHDLKLPKPDTEIHLWHVGPEGLTQHDQFQTRIDPDTGEVITPDHARKD